MIFYHFLLSKITFVANYVQIYFALHMINKEKLFNPVILQAQYFVWRNAFEVIAQTRAGGGLSPIFKHREQLKIQGEAEYFLTSFEVF